MAGETGGAGSCMGSGCGPGRRVNGAARPRGYVSVSSQGASRRLGGEGKRVQRGRGCGRGRAATSAPPTAGKRLLLLLLLEGAEPGRGPAQYT